ncbi:MATE family efflux transporter, partial [Pseudomonas syringae pv. tagetis]|uniref:MATE family efflux transporter n=1 Tax=Pseudomonas syringae group genomosp. 7 TaxID=251699 RepID=UPI00376F4F8A
YCAFFALAGALAPVIGQNIGANRVDRVLSAVVFTRKLVVCYVLAVWLMLVLCAGMIADLYQFGGDASDEYQPYSVWGGGHWD